MRRLACALVLAGLLAACGGGGSDGASGSGDGGSSGSGGTKATEPAKAPTAANYVDALVKASEGNGLGDDPKMNRCFAQSYVETVGAKALAAKISVDKLASETGMTVDTLGIMLTPAQRDAFYQRLKGCSDPKTYFVDIFSKGNSLDAEDKACLSGVLDDRILETMLVAAFDGDTTPVEGTQGMTTAFQRIGAACPHILQAGGLAQ
jgi:hypothetical protein